MHPKHTKGPVMCSPARLIRLTKTLALLAMAIAGGSAHAADPPYPSRPIRLVVASSPGGGLDSVARNISPKLSDGMGQTWVVDNRGGAGGNVGAEIVARASPDGYTALISSSTHFTVNPSLYKMAFSIEKDLQPITMLVTAEHIVVVHPGVPARTLKEFVALAKQKPGALNYASGGVGASLHLAGELLKKRAEINMTHIAYKGGGPAAAAVLAGETQVMIGTVASTIAFVTAGRLRALAAAGAKRSKLLPELPTVAESGYPGFDAGNWYALSVPGPTPKRIAERILNEAHKALHDAHVQTALARQGLDPVTSTPAELVARIKRETGIWASIIKEAGIRVE